jgi:hypothetical protein
MVRGLKLAGMVAGQSSDEDLGNTIAAGSRSALPQTPDAMEMATNRQPAMKAYQDSSGIDAIGAFGTLAARMGWDFLTHPGETARMLAENIPNSIPGVISGAMGASGGAAAGTAVAGPVGTVVGGAVGGVTGGFAGGVPTEFGAEFEQRVLNKAKEMGVNPNTPGALTPIIKEFRQEFQDKALAKGITTAGVDAVLTRLTFGASGAIERGLAKEGRAIAEQVAAKTITPEAAALRVAALEARKEAASTLQAKVMRHTTTGAGEMFGEGASEGLGRIATGDPFDPVDAIQEGILGMGQGVAMSLGGNVTNRALGISQTDPMESSVQRAKAAVETVTQARTLDEAIAAQAAAVAEQGAAAVRLDGAIPELAAAVDTWQGLTSEVSPANSLVVPEAPMAQLTDESNLTRLDNAQEILPALPAPAEQLALSAPAEQLALPAPQAPVDTQTGTLRVAPDGSVHPEFVSERQQTIAQQDAAGGPDVVRVPASAVVRDTPRPVPTDVITALRTPIKQRTPEQTTVIAAAKAVYTKTEYSSAQSAAMVKPTAPVTPTPVVTAAPTLSLPAPGQTQEVPSGALRVDRQGVVTKENYSEQAASAQALDARGGPDNLRVPASAVPTSAPAGTGRVRPSLNAVASALGVRPSERTVVHTKTIADAKASFTKAEYKAAQGMAMGKATTVDPKAKFSTDRDESTQRATPTEPAPASQAATPELLKQHEITAAALPKIAGPGMMGVGQHRMIQQIARIFGKTVVLFDGKAAGVTHTGAVFGGDNKTIYLNVKSQQAHLAVFGHELMHTLKAESPKAYDAILAVMKVTDTGTAEHAADYGKGSDTEELLSDLLGNRFMEPTFWKGVFQEIAKTHGDEIGRGVIQKLGAALMRTVNLAIKALSGQTGFAADKMVSNLNEIRDVMQKELAAYAVANRGPGSSPKGGLESSTVGKASTERAGKYDHLATRKINYPVKIEDTGETATVTVDAATALTDADKRMDTLDRLLSCIK